MNFGRSSSMARARRASSSTAPRWQPPPPPAAAPAAPHARRERPPQAEVALGRAVLERAAVLLAKELLEDHPEVLKRKRVRARETAAEADDSRVLRVFQELADVGCGEPPRALGEATLHGGRGAHEDRGRDARGTP